MCTVNACMSTEVAPLGNYINLLVCSVLAMFTSVVCRMIMREDFKQRR